MIEELNTEFSRYCRKFAEKLKIRSDMDATRGKRLFNIVFHNKTLLIAFCLLSLVIIAIIIGLPIPTHKPTIQGQLESTDYRVSTKVPSRVEKVCVHEGDYVEAGDTLVILSAPEVTAMERTAAAKHEATEATDALVKEGSRNEVIRTAYFPLAAGHCRPRRQSVHLPPYQQPGLTGSGVGAESRRGTGAA